jgi:hypothetical protein
VAAGSTSSLLRALPRAPLRPLRRPGIRRSLSTPELDGSEREVTAARGECAEEARGSPPRSECGGVDDRLTGHAGRRGASRHTAARGEPGGFAPRVAPSTGRVAAGSTSSLLRALPRAPLRPVKGANTSWGDHSSKCTSTRRHGIDSCAERAGRAPERINEVGCRARPEHRLRVAWRQLDR